MTTSGTPPRPGVMFFKKEKADLIEPNQALFPVPDFVVEVVSESTFEEQPHFEFVQELLK